DGSNSGGGGSSATQLGDNRALTLNRAGEVDRKADGVEAEKVDKKGNEFNYTYRNDSLAATPPQPPAQIGQKVIAGKDVTRQDQKLDEMKLGRQVAAATEAGQKGADLYYKPTDEAKRAIPRQAPAYPQLIVEEQLKEKNKAPDAASTTLGLTSATP